MIKSAEQTAVDFVRSWEISREEMLRGCYLRYFTPETEWENVGIGTTIGTDAAIEFMAGFGMNFPTIVSIPVTIDRLASKGNDVLMDRVDHFVDGTGKNFFSLRCMGSFEMRDGKIAKWRDIFNIRAIEEFLAAQKK